MAYKIFLKRSAEKELNNLPEKLHDRIVKRLYSLQVTPRPNNAKKLRGREGYRIRVGDYRVLYVVDEKQKRIEVYSVAHRKDVYR